MGGVYTSLRPSASPPPVCASVCSFIRAFACSSVVRLLVGSYFGPFACLFVCFCAVQGCGRAGLGHRGSMDVLLRGGERCGVAETSRDGVAELW